MSGDGKPRLVLASRSPRRRALLAELGLSHAADAAAGDGEPVSSDPAERVLGHARHKALEVRGRHPNSFLLAADTLVEADGVFYPQPADSAEAEAMLRSLANRDHRVWTGTVVLTPAGEEFSRADFAVVRFDGPSEASLQAWLQSGEWRGKAGAYGIQDDGVDWARLVEGTRGTVVGMCAETVHELLSNAGLPSDGIGR